MSTADKIATATPFFTHPSVSRSGGCPNLPAGRLTVTGTGDEPVTMSTTPPRPGIYRLIPPWEYRHLRFFGIPRIAGGSAAAVAGAICLSYGVYGWAAFFLVLGALNLADGSWYLTIAGSAPARA